MGWRNVDGARLLGLSRQKKADDLTQGAFWYAVEELDLKVSGGKLLMESTDRVKEVEEQKKEKRPDGTVVSTTTVTKKKVFKGKVSKRKLSERKPFEWQGVEPFAALFGRILAFRCIDALRREEHSFTVPKEKKGDKKNRGQLGETIAEDEERLLLEGVEDEDSEEQEDADEDEGLDLSPAGPPSRIDAEPRNGVEKKQKQSDKQVFAYQHVRLKSARDGDDDEQQGSAYEEEMPGTSPTQRRPNRSRFHPNLWK